jgi:gas vesicle protein
MNDYTGNSGKGVAEGISGISGISGFVLGAIVGASIALLFAPAPGHDTRRRVGETASRLGHKAREKFDEARRRGENAVHQGREMGREFVQGVESEVRNA